MLGKGVLIYLDYSIAMDDLFEQYFIWLRQVFILLRNVDLALKLEKFKFLI